MLFDSNVFRGVVLVSVLMFTALLVISVILARGLKNEQFIVLGLPLVLIIAFLMNEQEVIKDIYLIIPLILLPMLISRKKKVIEDNSSRGPLLLLGSFFVGMSSFLVLYSVGDALPLVSGLVPEKVFNSEEVKNIFLILLLLVISIYFSSQDKEKSRWS